MGRTDTPKESIENLLQVIQRQMHPEQPLDWDLLLDKFSLSSNYLSVSRALFSERMRYLFKCGLSTRVEALAFKVWRDCITNMIKNADYKYNMHNLHFKWNSKKNSHFRDNLCCLKEATTILELVLWKTRIIENTLKWGTTKFHKKIKTDESSIRIKCLITCGADIITGLVLPYCIGI